ncbi:MAG: hypothetical protein MK132_13970 [Lentisphaerales bacterium]|nr:hypothetical protein [Lentisphaerales bacterium]
MNILGMLMGLINVEKVKPGMVLAEKVMTPKKMMLLPEGIELTAAHLITFQTWGVTEVNIVGEAGVDEGSDMTPEEKEALEKELKIIFKHNDISKPLTKKLFELACMYPGKNL